MNKSKLTKARNTKLDSLWGRQLVTISDVLILSDQRQNLVTLQNIHNYLSSALIYSLLVYRRDFCQLTESIYCADSEL